MKGFKTLAATASAVALLVACGGGGSGGISSGGGDGDQAPKVAITSVKVIGDSLTDSGTFDGIPGYGRVFSVQGTGTSIWTELVAKSYGISSLCNYFKYTGTTFVQNPTQGCTSFGVGSSRINNPASKGGNNAPVSLRYQLAASLVASGGAYKSTDLMLIDGGGNDAADMIGAYLAGDNGATFAALMASQGITATADTVATGRAYMTALANTYFDSIKANALDKGATHVAIVNIPAVTKTPKMQNALKAVAAAKGQAQADAVEAQFRSWIAAFNVQLAARAAGNAAVAVVDMNTEMEDQIRNPSQYGLTNVTTPACPETPVNSKTYNFQTCTAEALSELRPTEPDWWKTYAFSDDFHPTPAAYKLLAQLVNRSLIIKGWL